MRGLGWDGHLHPTRSQVTRIVLSRQCLLSTPRVPPTIRGRDSLPSLFSTSIFPSSSFPLCPAGRLAISNIQTGLFAPLFRPLLLLTTTLPPAHPFDAQQHKTGLIQPRPSCRPKSPPRKPADRALPYLLSADAHLTRSLSLVGRCRSFLFSRTEERGKFPARCTGTRPIIDGFYVLRYRQTDQRGSEIVETKFRNQRRILRIRILGPAFCCSFSFDRDQTPRSLAKSRYFYRTVAHLHTQVLRTHCSPALRGNPNTTAPQTTLYEVPTYLPTLHTSHVRVCRHKRKTEPYSFFPIRAHL